MQKETIKEIATNAGLLGTSIIADAATSMPDPETVNNAMSLVTQILVTIIALWRIIKKPKK